MELRTENLVLRHWRPDDRAPFAALNADPRVMRHFTAALSRAQSDELADKIEAAFARDSFGLWAVETAHTPFIGFVGITRVPFDAPFTPAVEIGWRLAAQHWGRGYATEAARAVMRSASEDFGLDEVVAMTSVGNVASRRVMEKLGMTHDPADDFEHPGIPEGHPLRPHVLYRLAFSS